MMKILIATNSYPTKMNPTHQPFVKNICEGLKKEGCETDVLYNRYFDFFKSDLETGTRFSSVLKTVFLFFSYLPVIFFRAGKYDVIYSHAPVWPGFFMLAAQKIYGVTHATYVHGSVNRYVNRRGLLYKIAHYTLRKCNSVVANSAYTASCLETDYNCQSKVITPGYNESLFFYRPGSRGTDLFFVGSATKQKGIHLLLETLVKYKEFYKKRNLAIKMHFSGGLKDDLIRFAKKNGISEMINFGDRLPEEKLAGLYRNTKVFVFPSTKETWGLVGLEAIACGAVLVGSDSGGIKEYLRDGKNGFLFNDGDIDDLQDSIEKALHHFPEFEKKQPAISETVKEFSLTVAMKRTISLFEQLTR